MGFSLLVPAFLAGLAALVIPIIVHLRHRDKDRPFRFPSLMFLEQLPIRTSSRQRITDWPLLLLRLLALAALALAFARPVFMQKKATAADTRSKAMVILLDRSMSMGHTSVWPAAIDSARRIIASLGVRDRVGVVFFDDAAEVGQRLTEDKSAALAVLSSARALPRGTRFAPALRTARQMLLDAPYAAAEIVVISDLQRAGTVGVAGLDLPAGVQLRAVNVSAISHANTSIRAVESRRIADATRTLLAVKARVSTRELTAPRTIKATLTLNGREAGTQRVRLPASGETVVTFAPVAAIPGAVSGVISLEPDALVSDDRFYFVVPREDALKVSLVLPDDVSNEETMFLERALAIGRTPEIKIERTRAAALTAGTLPSGGVVLLWDVAPTQASVATLDAWLARGGGVVIAAGRRLSARTSASSFVPARITGAADRLTDRGGTISQVRQEHVLFAPFHGMDEALSSARFLRYPRLDVATGADVLARFDDGLPAIVEKRTGEGRLLLLAAPLDARSGDFPLQPAFLPFVRQLMVHASGRDQTPLWRTTADSWSLPESLKDPVVRAPDDALIRPKRDSLGSAIPLADAGLYAAFAGSASGAPGAIVAVNVAANESDLTPIDPKELLLGVGQSEHAVSANTAAPTPDELERRQLNWRFLLVVVALALIGETFMATRGWRAVARRTRPVDPERSLR